MIRVAAVLADSVVGWVRNFASRTCCGSCYKRRSLVRLHWALKELGSVKQLVLLQVGVYTVTIQVGSIRKQESLPLKIAVD